MNTTTQITSRDTLIPEELFIGSPVRTGYLWKNLVIEKRVSLGWLDKLYKGSILFAFWSVFSSPLD